MPDELTAGPATDALVAKAMGLVIQCTLGQWRYLRPDGIWADLPAYTATGDGMLAMMEWMQRKGWGFSIHSSDEAAVYADYGEASGDDWYVFTSKDDKMSGLSNADTAPLAVAKALLAAVEVGQ